MLRLHWKNATESAVGPEHGITEADFDGIDGAMVSARTTVVGQCRSGKLGYAALPGHGEYPAAVKARSTRC